MDMYLSRKHIPTGRFDKELGKWKLDLDIRVNGDPYPNLDTRNVVSITERVGTWEDAWAIHNWLATYTGIDDDGNEYWVSDNQLLALLEKVNKALADTDKAMDVLPPAGPFRDTEEQEKYLYDLWYTKDLLESLDLGGDAIAHAGFYYSAG